MLTEASRTLDEVSPTQIFRDFFQWVPLNVVLKGAEKMPDKRQREYKADIMAAKQKRQPPEELLQAMSAGADTCCKAGDIEMTAELAEYLLEYEDFPLSSAEEAADTIVERAGL